MINLTVLNISEKESPMPELPEIRSRAAEMHAHMRGKLLTSIDVIQPKSLNVPLEEFTSALTGAEVTRVDYRGKWIIVETSQGYLLLNLGMGGEILLTSCSSLPEKRRIVFTLEGGPGGAQECLSINFWWFGYVHYAPAGQLDQHTMTAKLGPNAVDVGLIDFKAMLEGQRGRLKTFLLDQTRLAGIGNAYIHDILFMARLHPQRPISTLSQEEIERLWAAIQKELNTSFEKGGAFYEVNLYGEKGGFLMDDILIGYREGQPCPECGSPIEKLKTGSTSSYICPNCQV
jgi:formamidopyrimidine-DNA glycosylase